jgi:MYXO-CTERM domain-containing protein
VQTIQECIPPGFGISGGSSDTGTGLSASTPDANGSSGGSGGSAGATSGAATSAQAADTAGSGTSDGKSGCAVSSGPRPASASGLLALALAALGAAFTRRARRQR